MELFNWIISGLDTFGGPLFTTTILVFAVLTLVVWVLKGIDLISNYKEAKVYARIRAKNRDQIKRR